MSAVTVHHLSHSYSDHTGRSIQALADVSLQIDNGAFVVILGESGCGKTTLLKLVAGFMKPDKGAITVDGHMIDRPGVDRGVVFQSDTLYPWLTVRENIAFSQRLRGVPRRERVRSAVRFLELVGLAPFADHHVWQLSGGMRQRVELARALNADPEVLLLDEPFGALDALMREQMQELILNIWAQTKKTVLMITHSIEEAVFLATRLVLMSPRPGRVVETLQLSFGGRYLTGTDARSIKSEPAFVAQREHVARRIFSRESS